MFVFARLQKDEIPTGLRLRVKVRVFKVVRNRGYFDIAFLKSGVAKAKTNFNKRFITISTNKIQKEFLFRILLVEI
jgi:predicted thioesterase